MKEYCGVVGIYGHKDAAKLAYLALYALQHRGEEAAGICTSDSSDLYLVKKMGHVGEVFDEASFAQLPGKNAIGHVRYSTTGSSTLLNAQPCKVDYSRGQIAIAHNGNLVNAQILRAESLRTTELFCMILLMYFAMATVISSGMRRVEWAFAKSKRGAR